MRLGEKDLRRSPMSDTLPYLGTEERGTGARDRFVAVKDTIRRPSGKMPVAADPPELALSAAWQAGHFAGPLRTVDGQSIEVIHRGTWSHGFGPDFRDALLLFDGRELRPGSVEVHLRTRSWTDHGHHLDARYDDVVLHAVLRHDGSEARRSDGALVPVVELGPLLSEPLALAGDLPSTVDWSRFGGEVCAPDLARSNPAAIRDALWRLGDLRLAAKSARLEAGLSTEPPGEVLYCEVWDGLGYSANREPMRALAAALPLAALEGALSTAASGVRPAIARGLLFGVAGFLPLSPADAAFAHLSPEEVDELEAAWAKHGAPWREALLPPTAWTRARVRPANHPAARLAAGAALLANATGGLVAAALAPVRAGGDPVESLRRLTRTVGHPGIGADRAAAIVANAVLPFACALAEQTSDAALLDAASAAWELLPAAEANEVTRRGQRQVAGEARLSGLGARGQQGLIHLDQSFCAPRRCYECPIAARVLSEDT
jgi:hypothetical protein